MAEKPFKPRRVWAFPSLEDAAKAMGVPPEVLRERDAFLDTVRGLARWREVQCPACGSVEERAGVSGQCRKSSGHDTMGVPHVQRADAYDRLVFQRANQQGLVAPYEDRLQAAGYEKQGRDWDGTCPECLAPSLFTCAAPFSNKTDARLGSHQARRDAQQPKENPA